MIMSGPEARAPGRRSATEWRAPSKDYCRLGSLLISARIARSITVKR
jgi:hypothetical protein